MNLIDVKNLKVEYQNKHESVIVLNDLSFELKQKEILVIFGDSGCGKSTLLKTIAGLKAPISGEIMINGNDINDFDIKSRNFSYIFQQNNLYTFTSIYNNIAMPLKAQKIDIDEIERRVEKIASHFKIGHLLSRKPKHLSGGQIQLVALAKAMIKQPDFILFDEPFANLDLPTRIAMRLEVKKINETYGTAMIFVTHDVNEAYELADRILILKEGTIKEELTTTQFFKNQIEQVVMLEHKGEVKLS